MKTKESIKSAALKLFNEQGLGEANLRDVATAMGKSYGNITYHYPNKAALVWELYMGMTEELKQLTGRFAQSESLFSAVLSAPSQTFDVSIKYVFLYRDYAEIMRGYPEIAVKVNEANEARKKALLPVFMALVGRGIFRKDITETEILYLMELSGIVRTFFFIRLGNQLPDAEGLKADYIRFVNRLLWPYLSEIGMQEYLKVIELRQA